MQHSAQGSTEIKFIFFFVLSVCRYCKIRNFYRKFSSAPFGKIRPRILPANSFFPGPLLAFWPEFRPPGNTAMSSCCRLKAHTNHLSSTPGATPFTIGNQEDQHIQPIKTRKKVKNRFWSVSEFGEVTRAIQCQLVSILVVFLRKGELVSVQCGSHKNCEIL
jgi:hypothetical protein